MGTRLARNFEKFRESCGLLGIFSHDIGDIETEMPKIVSLERFPPYGSYIWRTSFHSYKMNIKASFGEREREEAGLRHVEYAIPCTGIVRHKVRMRWGRNDNCWNYSSPAAIITIFSYFSGDCESVLAYLCRYHVTIDTDIFPTPFQSTLWHYGIHILHVYINVLRYAGDSCIR